MNVGGAGIAGVNVALTLIMLILPLLAVLILINLGYLKRTSRTKRILSYIVISVVTVAIEIVLARALDVDFLSFVFCLFGYMLLLVIITFFVCRSSVRTILVARRIIGIGSIILIPSIYFLTRAPKRYTNPLFEKELAEALNLTLVSKDSLYNAYKLVIVNDTVAGFYHRWVDGGPKSVSGYFIKSISNSNFRFFIEYGGHLSQDYALNYSDNSIVLGGDGGNLIRRIYPDKTESTYFVSHHPEFQTYSRLIYKNLQILSNGTRFLIYDEAAQRLVLDKEAFASSMLLGNYFMYSELTGNMRTLKCLNLDNLKILWSQPISPILGSRAYNLKDQDMHESGDKFVVKSDKAAYVLEKQTGMTRWVYPWKFSSAYDNITMIDSNLFYVSDGNLLKSYLVHSGKSNWQVRNVKLYGLYSKFIIASSMDEKLFIIIDKRSGKILKKIRRSESVTDLRLIGDYLLVRSGDVTAIYE